MTLMVGLLGRASHDESSNQTGLIHPQEDRINIIPQFFLFCFSERKCQFFIFSARSGCQLLVDKKMEYLIQAIETKKVARPDEKVARPDATPTSTKATLTPSKFKDQHIKNYQLHSNSTPALTDKKMIQAQKAKRALALTPLVAAASKPTELTAAGRIRVTTVRLSSYRYMFFFSFLLFSSSLLFPQKKIICATSLLFSIHADVRQFSDTTGAQYQTIRREEYLPHKKGEHSSNASTITMQSTFLRNICNRHLPPLERKKITITQIRLRLVFFAGSVSSWDEVSRLTHRRYTAPGTAFLTTCQYYAQKPSSNPTPFS